MAAAVEGGRLAIVVFVGGGGFFLACFVSVGEDECFSLSYGVTYIYVHTYLKKKTFMVIDTNQNSNLPRHAPHCGDSPTEISFITQLGNFLLLLE